MIIITMVILIDEMFVKRRGCGWSEQETTTDSTSEEGNGIPFFLVGRFLLVWRVSDRLSVCLSDSYFEMFFNIFKLLCEFAGDHSRTLPRGGHTLPRMIMRMVDCRVQWCYCHRHNQLFVKGLHDRTTGLGESAEQAYFARQSDSLSISPKPLQEDTSSFLLSSISIALVGIFYELYIQRERSNSFNVCMHACMHACIHGHSRNKRAYRCPTKTINAKTLGVIASSIVFFFLHTHVSGWIPCVQHTTTFS